MYSQGSSLVSDQVGQLVENLLEGRVFDVPSFDLLDGVKNSGVVFSAKLLTNFLERKPCEFSAEVHGRLSWENETLGLFPSPQIRRTNIKKGSHLFLNGVNRDGVIGLPDNIPQYVLGHLEGDLRVGEGGKGTNTDQGPLEDSNVGINICRQEKGNVVRKVGSLKRGLFLEDGNPGLNVRCLNVGDESPLES